MRTATLWLLATILLGVFLAFSIAQPPVDLDPRDPRAVECRLTTCQGKFLNAH
jgi:hypothetical protein